MATGWSGPAKGARQRVPGEGTKRRYLTGLDGLRAIAVVSVMLFHFDTGLDGGFLGVDVFFVLSGYLITSQLLTRWRDGQVDLKHFWTARIRRLFPAVALLLAVVSLLMLVLDRGGVRSYLGDVLAAGTYTSNWWYVFNERSYFEAAGRPPVLQHLWSLAVEEQFYVVWPLVVAGLTFAFVRPGARRWALLVLSVVGAVASSLWMGLGTAAADLPAAGDTSRFYFGTDSHAMGLLTGAALAALRDGRGFSDRLPALKPAGFLWTVVGLAGLVGLGWYFVAMDETSEGLYRWGFAALALLVAVLVVAATRPGPVEWLLSLAPCATSVPAATRCTCGTGRSRPSRARHRRPVVRAGGDGGALGPDPGRGRAQLPPGGEPRPQAGLPGHLGPSAARRPCAGHRGQRPGHRCGGARRRHDGGRRDHRPAAAPGAAGRGGPGRLRDRRRR
ncbi:hypothetical protein BJF82_00430 [Kytococcus sp. CUA-901]|nr:hypothetical protein BJF82_00430 [Kytococcus sp. CUA-901]